VQSKGLFSSQIQGRLTINYILDLNELVVFITNINLTGIVRMTKELELLESSLFKDIRAQAFSIRKQADLIFIDMIGNG
jgi:hypothetical protein